MSTVNSHFAQTPSLLGKVKRSKFERPHDIKLSFNCGQLIPFDCEEVLPGDSIKRETNSLVRLQSLLTPMFDDLKLDMWYFFVPNRLVWDHWQEFCGENSKSAWIPETVYQIPQIKVDCTNEKYDYSVFDYLGVPKVPNNGHIMVNALPFRAYGLIYNEWFRDENLQDPVLLHSDDTGQDNISGIGYLGKPYIAGKYHDYFTSCTPSPQKGPDVSLPMGGQAPVFGNGYALGLTDGRTSRGLYAHNTTDGYMSADRASFKQSIGSGVSGTTAQGVTVGLLRKDDLLSSEYKYSGVYADLESAVAPSINALRLAMATQQLYEIDTQGTRYTSILRNHFGVVSPDARLQRPELLSYNSYNLNISQVVQTSESNTTPQGTLTGMSVTGDSNSSFDKSFVEHGYIIGVMTVRYKNSYQQGLHRMFSRKHRFDYYWPVFANIGNQPVLNKEIYAQGTSADDEVFGYQEAWAEYRYSPDRVCAEMRSSFAQSLDSWHLADNYDSLPKLSPDWIIEDKSNLDRALAVTSKVANQVFADIQINDIAVRPLPTYSIPGLLRM